MNRYVTQWSEADTPFTAASQDTYMFAMKEVDGEKTRIRFLVGKVIITSRKYKAGFVISVVRRNRTLSHFIDKRDGESLEIPTFIRRFTPLIGELAAWEIVAHYS